MLLLLLPLLLRALEWLLWIRNNDLLLLFFFTSFNVIRGIDGRGRMILTKSAETDGRMKDGDEYVHVGRVFWRGSYQNSSFTFAHFNTTNAATLRLRIKYVFLFVSQHRVGASWYFVRNFNDPIFLLLLSVVVEYLSEMLLYSLPPFHRFHIFFSSLFSSFVNTLTLVTVTVTANG